MSLLLLVLLALGMSADVQAQRRGDRQPPQIMVTIPTPQPTYVSPTATLTIGGVASDNVGVTRVTWYTYPDLAQHGTADGTMSWRFTMTLPVGETLVAVTAHDAAGNSREDGIWVTVRALPPPLGPITVEIVQVSDPGDTIAIERCTAQVSCPQMVTVAAIPWAERQWIDQDVLPTAQYCYRAAVAQGSILLPFSATVCSP